MELSRAWLPGCRRPGTPFRHDPGADGLSTTAVADRPGFRRVACTAHFVAISRGFLTTLKYGDGIERAPRRAIGPVGRELVAGAFALAPCQRRYRRRGTRRGDRSDPALNAVSSAPSGLPLTACAREIPGAAVDGSTHATAVAVAANGDDIVLARLADPGQTSL